MPNLIGTKWGNPALGTPGGVVTWSIAKAGEGLGRFGVGASVNPRNFLTFDYEKVIREALAEWSAAGDIEFIRVEDKGGAAGDGAIADMRFFFGAIPGNIIGYAFYPTSGGAPIGGDVLLATTSRFNDERALFRGLVLHEIGHALGLGHVESDSILTPVISESSLQADDIDGITQIYGPQDGADPVYDLRGTRKITILEGLDNLTLNGNERGNKVQGSDRDETINGAGGSDKLQGGGGDDALNGGKGRDTLMGGAGADTINGGDGYDVADYRHSVDGITLDQRAPAGTGGDATGDVLSGIEKIVGSEQNDLIIGIGLDDKFIGRGGADQLWGGSGDDTLKGKSGDDWLFGQAGADSLEGNSGEDQLLGHEDNDILRGGRHNDTLIGGAGDDELRGGSERDHMDGGTGDDWLKGGSQADTFIFLDGHGDDTIVDFDALNPNEVIDLSGVSALSDFGDVAAAASNTGAGVLIDTGGGDSILLSGLRLGQLGADDFLF